jgi:hypothetical protein
MKHEQLETSPVELTTEQLKQVAGGSAENTFFSLDTTPPSTIKITGTASDSHGEVINPHSHVIK